MVKIDIARPLHGHREQMRLAVTLEIGEGAFVAIAGESGSGKTTLLRILAGLEEAEGEIVVGDEVWLAPAVKLPPQKRRIGFVFQEYALFDNMSVEENLLFVAKDRALAAHLLEITGLSQMRSRSPKQLSGGQKQRVALCRAMMRRPRLLLLDEPLSALDPAMRSRLQGEILSLHREFGTTTLMVSHDPSEIYRLAERVVILEAGRVTADGTPAEVLLQTSGSQKFSFEGELLEIREADLLRVAIVAIGQQLVEVVLTRSEAERLTIGQRVQVSTKAFAPVLKAH